MWVFVRPQCVLMGRCEVVLATYGTTKVSFPHTYISTHELAGDVAITQHVCLMSTLIPIIIHGDIGEICTLMDEELILAYATVGRSLFFKVT